LHLLLLLLLLVPLQDRHFQGYLLALWVLLQCAKQQQQQQAAAVRAGAATAGVVSMCSCSWSCCLHLSNA
jgi:hypothetical protein